MGNDVQEFCLKWNNHHSTLISVLDLLLEREALVDVILAAEGQFLKVHRLVLFACSQYFQDLLNQQLDKHAVVFLKDVLFRDLRALVDFMYRGEVNISQDHLDSFLRTAEALKIKGLADKENHNKYRESLPNSAIPSMCEQSLLHEQLAHPPVLTPCSRLEKNSEEPPILQKHSNNDDSSVTDQENDVQEVSDADEENDSDSPFVAASLKEEEMETDLTGDQFECAEDWSVKEDEEAWSTGNSHDDGLSATSENRVTNHLNQDTGPETWAADRSPGPSSNPEYNVIFTQSQTTKGRGSKRLNKKEMAIHSEEKPHPCPRCYRRYKRKSNLMSHVRYECGVTPQFECPICQHKVSHPRYIHKHIRRKHSGAENQPSVTCNSTSNVTFD